MTEASERYSRLSDAFAAKVAAVSDDAWSNPSPCEGWTARDVVRHVVSAQGMFLGFIGQEVGDVASVDDDPAAAWDAVRAKVQANLEDPARARQEFDGLGGRSTFESAADRFLAFDLVVHGWDLARAAGLDESIDPADITRTRAQADAFGPGIRGPQVCGPEVETPEGADDQAKLLAFLGRHP